MISSAESERRHAASRGVVSDRRHSSGVAEMNIRQIEIHIFPPDVLTFRCSLDQETGERRLESRFDIYNPSTQLLAFRIRINSAATEKYSVKPRIGVMKPEGEGEIVILHRDVCPRSNDEAEAWLRHESLRMSGEDLGPTEMSASKASASKASASKAPLSQPPSGDSFMICWAPIGSLPRSETDAAEYWRKVPKQIVKSRILKCRLDVEYFSAAATFVGETPFLPRQRETTTMSDNNNNNNKMADIRSRYRNRNEAMEFPETETKGGRGDESFGRRRGEEGEEEEEEEEQRFIRKIGDSSENCEYYDLDEDSQSKSICFKTGDRNFVDFSDCQADYRSLSAEGDAINKRRGRELPARLGSPSYTVLNSVNPNAPAISSPGTPLTPRSSRWRRGILVVVVAGAIAVAACWTLFLRLEAQEPPEQTFFHWITKQEKTILMTSEETSKETISETFQETYDVVLKFFGWIWEILEKEILPHSVAEHGDWSRMIKLQETN